MRPYLLDVNVLLALHHQSHEHFLRAQAWFDRTPNRRWASCVTTQQGFIRITSQPAFPSHLASVKESVALLADSIETHGSNHEFWPENSQVCDALSNVPIQLGHRQITDYYLSKLCEQYGGKLATFDATILGLVGRSQAEDLVESIP